MNAPASEPVALRFLDREFHIACAPDEREGLLAAGRYLDDKMRALKSSAKVPGFDRIAVLAAVSIAHELLTLRGQHNTQEQSLTDGLAALRKKLDGLLDASVK
ncbi:cell division protein ZapA [Luteibacter sp. 621]|jgi:cell division protein ZapA|uniref:cell division protein ZapA n=1 Tax=Luteibacter sp. 621 TaxID=3373916 RepID=UPI003D25128D